MSIAMTYPLDVDNQRIFFTNIVDSLPTFDEVGCPAMFSMSSVVIDLNHQNCNFKMKTIRFNAVEHIRWAILSNLSRVQTR